MMDSARSESDPKVVMIAGTDDIQDFDKQYAEYLAHKEQLQALRNFSKSLLKSLAK